MTNHSRTEPAATPQSRREASPADEAAAFQALVREGQELRRAFEAKTAKMRIITPDDMKVRSR